jgi:serine protease Do
MNKRFLSLGLLAFALTASIGLFAQKETKPKTEKNESITIRRKGGDKSEKLTIVVDGDKITVNGKPIEDLKDSDIEVLRNEGIRSIMPRVRARIAPMPGGAKAFGLNWSSNSAYLGVVTEKADKGAKINTVDKGSAAEKAGLQKDDIITRINDTKIEDGNSLYDAVGKLKPEDKVNIVYLRDGKEATTTATLGKNTNSTFRSFNFDNNFDVNPGFNFNRDFNFKTPEAPQFNFQYNVKPRIGMEIQDVEEGKGAKILDVDDDGPAAKAGLKKDDVVKEVNGKAIDGVDDLRSSLKELKQGDSVKLGITRDGKSQTVEVKIPKKLKTAEL